MTAEKTQTAGAGGVDTPYSPPPAPAPIQRKKMRDRLAMLEARQRVRVDHLVAVRALVDKKQREIDNLKNQLEGREV